MALTAGSLLATCAGDTVKVFDTSAPAADQSGDPCLFKYSPSPDCQVNSLKWNHTNMVLASAGEDHKISLWTQKLQSVVAVASDSADAVEESIMAINFSTKSSRYLCSGGTGKVVRVWDTQRKRCIKWLKGHTDVITSVMYNCKDEHVASASTGGDLILHNLASGSRIAELKDPHRQVLRVLEFSRLSRHLLVASGDDGSVHLWDTTGRSPKVSWIKQHLAPTAGVCFSPPNDKVLASVGLDKKMYIFDVGVKRPVHSLSYETPYSSVVFKDDGSVLAAGTNDGRIVFYDMRGVKPQPSTVLRAYGPSKAVTGLSWQRSSPVYVNEKSWTMEMALLGPSRDDPVIMPDPLPPQGGVRGRSKFDTATSRNMGRPNPFSSERPPTGEETPANHLTTNGSISRLHILRNDLIRSKDDMEVFSPLVDVQPIVPSATKYWDYGGELKRLDEVDGRLKYHKFSSLDDSIERTRSLQDEQLLNVSSMDSTPPAILKDNRSPSVTPPEAWGGDGGADPGPFRLHTTSRFATGITSASAAFSGHLDHGTTSETPTALPVSRSPVKNLNQETAISDSTPVERLIEGSYSWASPLLSEQVLSPSNRRERRDEMAMEESRENGAHLRLDASSYQPQTSYKRSPHQQGQPAFAFQLVQRALEESLTGVHRSIHEDVHNLHLELLRQFHIQQIEMDALLGKVLAKQEELMEEVQMLRKENQQLLRYL